MERRVNELGGDHFFGREYQYISEEDLKRGTELKSATGKPAFTLPREKKKAMCLLFLGEKQGLIPWNGLKDSENSDREEEQLQVYEKTGPGGKKRQEVPLSVGLRAKLSI